MEWCGRGAATNGVDIVRYFYSFITSLLFVVFVLVGQLVGGLAGELLYAIYGGMALNMPDFMFEIGPKLISGFAGGALAGFLCAKIYKNIHLVSALIFPSILMAVMIAAAFYNLATVGFTSEVAVRIAVHGFTWYFYFYVLSKQIKKRV